MLLKYISLLLLSLTVASCQISPCAPCTRHQCVKPCSKKGKKKRLKTKAAAQPSPMATTPQTAAPTTCNTCCARCTVRMYAPETAESLDSGNPLSLYDLKVMSWACIPPEVINQEIDQSESHILLTPQLEKQLELWGVSTRVIDHLRDSSAWE